MRKLLVLSVIVLPLYATSTVQARTLPVFPANHYRHYSTPHHHVIHHKKVKKKVQHHALNRFQFRALIYRTHPCLARIIDNEDGTWEPTRNFGGGYGNVYGPYGLGQANPGTKMASYGPDWRTSLWTQFRWLKAYARKFGSECGAWAHWQIYKAW